MTYWLRIEGDDDYELGPLVNADIKDLVEGHYNVQATLLLVPSESARAAYAVGLELGDLRDTRAKLQRVIEALIDAGNDLVGNLDTGYSDSLAYRRVWDDLVRRVSA